MVTHCTFACEVAYIFHCQLVFCSGSDCEDQITRYYSSPVQLDHLKRVLGSSKLYQCEIHLLSAINRMNDEIISCMNITANLVNRFRGSKKAAIHLHDGLY